MSQKTTDKGLKKAEACKTVDPMEVCFLCGSAMEPKQGKLMCVRRAQGCPWMIGCCGQ